MDTSTCVGLVPVKSPAFGKSRLGGPPTRRRDLAAAFALDTVTACLAAGPVAAVLAITDDAAFAAQLAAAGCAVMPDGPSGQLNTSLVLAASEARRRWPDLRPFALCADLPALRPHDLTTALDRLGGDEAAFVADLRGTGTTLYTAPYDGFAPSFGVDSRAAHRAQGAREIDGDLESLRLDVDDPEDLARARGLGLGPRTRALDVP